MRPRRPRRRGDWGRRLPAVSILDSPISSSDSDGFPCDSSCSGDSVTSQENFPHNHTHRRVISTPPSHLSPIPVGSHPPPRNAPFPNPYPNDLNARRPDAITARVHRTEMRDVSLTEYAAAELPDLGFLLKGIIPGFGSASIANFPSTNVPSSLAPPLQRRKSAPTGSFRPKPPHPRSTPDQDRPGNRPPTFPDSSKHSPHTRVQVGNKYEALNTVSTARDQLARQESSRRSRRAPTQASRPAKLSPKVSTRRFPDDLAISRRVAEKKDPDSMQRILLVERLFSLYKGLVCRQEVHTPQRR